MSTQHGHAGRQIILRVTVLNVTLALRAHDVISKMRNTWSRRSTHLRGNGVVITCRPTNGSQIKTGIIGAAVRFETGNANIESKYRCGGNAVGVTRSECVGVIALGTAIRAEARP